MPLFQRNIVFLLAPPFELLDLTGPIEVFHAANGLMASARKPYSLHLVTTKRSSSVESTAGFKVSPVTHFLDFHDPVHTLLVVGGEGAMKHHDPRLLHWMKEQAQDARRIGSVCTGAFLLAQAGLLHGKRATTHWQYCKQLANQYARVRVESDPIYIKDGRVYTTAGVSAGIDVSLALVEEDLGSKVSSQVAQHLVLFLRRPGGQKQFSTALMMQQRALSKEMRDLPAWAMSRISDRIDVKTMAESCAMSARTFARRFTEQFETTPAAWLQSLRVDLACTRLQSGKPLKAVARECGFQSQTSMRRAFLANLNVTPTDYQERFRRSPALNKTQKSR